MALGGILLGAAAGGQLLSSLAGMSGGGGKGRVQRRMQQAADAQGRVAQAQIDLIPAITRSAGAITSFAPALQGYAGAQGNIAEMLLSRGREISGMTPEIAVMARKRADAVASAAKYFEAAMDVTNPLFRQAASSEEVKLRRAVSEGVHQSFLMKRKMQARGLSAGMRSEREDEGRARALSEGYAQAALVSDDLARQRLMQTGGNMLNIAQGYGGATESMMAPTRNIAAAASMDEAAGGAVTRAAGITGGIADLFGAGANLVANASGMLGQVGGSYARQGRLAADVGMMNMQQSALSSARQSQLFDMLGMFGSALGGVEQLNRLFGGRQPTQVIPNMGPGSGSVGTLGGFQLGGLTGPYFSA